MNWNYRVGKKKTKDEEDLYGIIEVYYDVEYDEQNPFGVQKPVGYTDFVDCNNLESVEDVKAELEHMLQAFRFEVFEMKEDA